MSKAAIVLVFLVTVIFAAHGQSTTTKRALAGAAKSLSEQSDRQAALNAEIELARAKAEIEVDKQRKLQALRTEQSPQRTLDQEELKIRQRHPQWVGILNSSIFKTWMRTRPVGYQEVCMRTSEADVMSSCIDDFFNAKIVQVQ